MSHLLEPASTGRAKCRGCGRRIERGELRFGERFGNPYGDGDKAEMTVWFHPACAAYKRPTPLLEALGQTTESVPERESLERAARASSALQRLPRIDGAERAPSGQAKCRSCHQPIARGAWRIRLVFYEEGLFAPGGFVHLECRKAYFETDDILDPLLHFSANLDPNEREELRHACGSPSDAARPDAPPA